MPNRLTYIGKQLSARIRTGWLPGCLAVTLLLCAAGCSTGRRATTIADQDHAYTPEPPAREAYRIKPGDKLSIRNLNWVSDLVPEPGAVQANPGSGLLLKVNSLGQIGLPEAGLVRVSGMTCGQLADTLSLIYRDLLKNPVFEVEVTNLRVKVLGAVNIQGLVAIDNERVTLADVIAGAGGIKFTEAGKTIQIIRGEGTQRRVIEYDFEQLGDPRIINQQVFDNDLIYVPNSRNVVRAVNYQRNVTLVQPVLALLNFTVLVINLIRFTR